MMKNILSYIYKYMGKDTLRYNWLGSGRRDWRSIFGWRNMCVNDDGGYYISTGDWLTVDEYLEILAVDNYGKS